MNLLLLNASAGRARRVREGGRDYLVAPLTSIVPGVLSGSKGPLYYPEDEVSRNVGDWDGMPLTVYHPFDPATGAHLSASEPGVVERQGIGEVRKSTYNGKLRHEGWFDAERTRAVDPRVYQSLVSGKPIELSTGLYTDNEVAPPNSYHNGRPYGHVARNYRPDHIAVLPDQQGACSVRDGCGVMVNKQGPTENAVPQSTLEKFIGWLVGNAPSAGHPQVRGVGGKFGNGPDLEALKRAVDASAQGKGPDGKGGPPLGPDDMEEGEEDDIKAQHGGGDDKSKAILAPDDGKGTKNANPEGHNQYTSSDAVSASKDAAKASTNANKHVATRAERIVDTAKVAHDANEDQNHEAAHKTHEQAAEAHSKMAEFHDTTSAGSAARHEKASQAHGRASLIHSQLADYHKEFLKADNMAGNMIPQGGTAPVAAPEPDAQAASKDAAVASMDHPPARDHAMKAMDFGNGGKPGLAAGRHDKAAEAHDDAATESRKAGDEAGAQDHEHAAMLHRKASSMHSLAVRNAGANQPRHAEKGQYLPQGAGTGKGPPHEAAGKGYKGDNEPDDDEDDDDMAENTQKAVDKFDRTETIDHLTTNCPCWKGGNDVLNLMSDRQLASVARNAKAEGSNADTTGKGGSVQAGGEEDEDDHETADDHTSEDLFTDKVKVKKEKMSENQFLNSLPPSYREAVVNAQEITRRERVRLVNRLITNVGGDAARRRLGARLMQKPLAELRDMLAMVPEPAYNTGGGEEGNVPLYNGAGYGADDNTNNRGVSDDDILALPVTNFADIAKEQRRQRQQA